MYRKYGGATDYTINLSIPKGCCDPDIFNGNPEGSLGNQQMEDRCVRLVNKHSASASDGNSDAAVI